MRTIDRVHYAGLTVSSENFQENWLKVPGFFSQGWNLARPAGNY